MSIRFEAELAWRHLRAGGSQTLLIIAGVAVAVTLVVFISGIITGVQRRFVTTIIGSSPQVVVRAPEITPRVASRLPGVPADVPVIGQVLPRARARTELTDWLALQQELRRLPQVRAVAPGVSGQAILIFRGREAGVRVSGAPPEEQDQIVHLTDKLILGSYLSLGLAEAVIEYPQAEALGIGLGDRIRLVASGGRSATYRVAGIVDVGQAFGGVSSVYVTLRAAQGLFGTGTAVTAFSLALDDIFAADRVADQIEAAFPVDAESWIRENPLLANAFRAQNAMTLLISGFSLLAAGFATASVLIVSVLKRSREIGILKSMGAHRRQVILIFSCEGAGIALLGTTVGAALGSGLIVAFRQIPQPVRVPGQAPDPLLPGIIDPLVLALAVGATILVTIIASVLPARQAANLDPVEVIRSG
jgi:lipoprotein-releasing system permease protein